EKLRHAGIGLVRKRRKKKRHARRREILHGRRDDTGRRAGFCKSVLVTDIVKEADLPRPRPVQRGDILDQNRGIGAFRKRQVYFLSQIRKPERTLTTEKTGISHPGS